MTVLLLYVCKKEEIYGKPYVRHIYVLVIPHLRVVSTNIYISLQLELNELNKINGGITSD